jgi:hypothetical protein
MHISNATASDETGFQRQLVILANLQIGGIFHNRPLSRLSKKNSCSNPHSRFHPEFQYRSSTRFLLSASFRSEI